VLGQSLNFRFTSTGADRLASDFVRSGTAADVAARATGKLAGVNARLADSSAIAAKSARLVADSLERQRKAADVSAGATLALSRADKILDEAEGVLTGHTIELELALKREAAAADKAGRANEGAAGGLSALAGSGGIPGGGMGAAVAAGIALSPVLITVGAGLGGLALGAAGTISPLLKAAHATGGLQANMAKLDPEQRKAAQSLLGLQTSYRGFEKALAPQVLGDFNAGVRVAGHLLHDLQPVSIATGKALGGALGQIDATFAGQTWQQFFQFMSRTAGPDVQQLGNLFTSLMQSLPPLVEGLQPLASGILTVGTDAAKALGPVGQLLQQIDQNNHSINSSAKGLDSWTVSLTNTIPGGRAVNNWITSVQHNIQGTGDTAKAAGPQTAGFGVSVYTTGKSAAVAAAKLQSLAQAVTALDTAESGSLSNQLAYTNALLASKQGALSLRTALAKSGDRIGLHTAAERNSFSTANSYIQNLVDTANASWKSGHGTDGAIKAIRNGLPILEQAKTHNRDYWKEVQTLVTWLHKLRDVKRIHDVVKLTGSGAWTFSLGGTGSFPSRHIKGHAAGTTSAPPGWAWVGEKGPELMKFRGGETVIPNHRLPGYAAGTGYAGSLAGLQPWGQRNWDATITAMTKAFVAAGKQQQASLGGAPGALGGPTSASAAAAQAYARSRLGAYGWSGSQMPYLALLWTQESGWNRLARNPSSGAYGIPQALPGSKMGAAANPPLSSAAAQINWGLGYIGGRYGSPAGAWAHERAFNWYAGGTGGAMPGWAWVGERGPELVRFSGGEDVLDSATSKAVTRGYAKGTDLARLGRELLRRHHSGILDTEIRNTSARYHQDMLLASAPGGRHRQHYAKLARSEHHHLRSLEHTRAAERAYRAVLARRVATLEATIKAARHAGLPGEAAHLEARLRRAQRIVHNIDLWISGKPKPKAVVKPKAAAAAVPTGNMDIADWAAYLDAIHGGAPGLAAFATGSWFVPATAPAVVHKGEMIFPADVAQSIRDGASGGGGDVNVRVFIGNEEISTLARVEIEKSDRKFNRRVAAGTGRR
jgi:hypothetical protein